MICKTFFRSKVGVRDFKDCAGEFKELCFPILSVISLLEKDDVLQQ